MSPKTVEIADYLSSPTSDDFYHSPTIQLAVRKNPRTFVDPGAVSIRTVRITIDRDAFRDLITACARVQRELGEDPAYYLVGFVTYVHLTAFGRVPPVATFRGAPVLAEPSVEELVQAVPGFELLGAPGWNREYVTRGPASSKFWTAP